MAKNKHRGRRGDALEFENVNNPGEFKKDNKKAYLICATFVTILLVGYLSSGPAAGAHNPAKRAHH